MSLGRLLAAGKSLVGARDGAGRYRVNKQIALPKFISPRNPFAPQTQAKPLPMDAESSSKVSERKSVVATAKSDKAMAAKGDLTISIGRRAARWLGEWGHRINVMPRFARKPGPVKSLVVRPSRTQVQPELSLDNVQVMRNDLSDADFEIIPRKVTAAPAERPVSSTDHERLATVSGMWGRLTTRLFGAGQM